MKKDIKIGFDEAINSYIVRLPDMVELEANYVKAEIKSDTEVTLNEYFEAYDWLGN